MISVLLYGRNDTHGYNLHKRAVLSFNAIAEQLTFDGDEILFVDYNTNNDLPTFPEAIQDLLSEKAQRLLRIIRVRPEFHRANFATKTELQVLEPVARNIGVRRTSVKNKWILSTNTDMIFVPKSAGSLSDIARCLDEGFYELPRFEVPEMIWESLNRFDGPNIIEQLRVLSKKFHLDDVVMIHPLILYDAPGDFQLVLRKDLFQIDGFDQEMVLGWHVDSNLAARMVLKRGKIVTLEPFLRGYHCGHTRHSTTYHTSGALENDFNRFVFRIGRPDLPHQRDTWGFPEESFEEFRLRETDVFARYYRAVTLAVPMEQSSPLVSVYTAESYDQLDYDLNHAVPHILNLLAAFPPGTAIAYFGCRVGLLERLLLAMPELFPRGRLLLPDDSSSGPPRVGMNNWLAVHSTEICLDQADVLLFEFFSPSQTKSYPQLAHWYLNQLARAQRLFLTAVDYEVARLEAGHAAARRFLVVNAMNTRFETFVRAHLAFSRAPFSVRVLSGFLRHQDPPWFPSAQTSPVKSRSGITRLLVPPAVELETSKAILETWRELRAGGLPNADDLINDYRTPLLAFLGSGEVPTVLGGSEAEILVGITDDSEHSRDILTAADGPKPLPPGGGLFEVLDWDDPNWFWFARRYMGGDDAADWFRRTPTTWELISILRVMKLNSLLIPECRVLVCSWKPDALAVLLSHYTNVVVAKFQSAGSTCLAAPRQCAPSGEVFEQARLHSWSAGDNQLFDAILVPRHGLFVGGRTLMQGILNQLWQLLKPSGKLVCSALVDIGPSRAGGHLHVSDLKRPDLLDSFGAGGRFRPLWPVRMAVSPASLERCVTRTFSGRTIEATCVRANGSTAVKGVFTLDRHDP